MTSIDTHGPLFSFEAEAMVKRWSQSEQHRIAQEGLRRVRERLSHSLRHPTGYYMGHTRVQDNGAVASNVTDSNVVYGPWLEGVGSRNRTTRFKGYHSFRLAGQQLSADAGHIAQSDIHPLIRELNG